MGAKIVTNDFNLNKVATVQGFSVLNVNQLAQALKPAVLPGEPMRVLILREGKEPNQGVAYLDDGTMVVVDGARRMINRSVDVIVTSVHQTTAGKMIFGRLEERTEQPAPPLRQAAAAGRVDGNGGVRSEATSRVENIRASFGARHAGSPGSPHLSRARCGLVESSHRGGHTAHFIKFRIEVDAGRLGLRAAAADFTPRPA